MVEVVDHLAARSLGTLLRCSRGTAASTCNTLSQKAIEGCIVGFTGRSAQLAYSLSSARNPPFNRPRRNLPETGASFATDGVNYYKLKFY